jgi:hypothetical protein
LSVTNLDLKTPKMNEGTIKKYLNEVQNQMLELMKNQIIFHTNHPISMICRIFREEFGRSYKKYVKPKKNEAGVYDKVNVI